jgi:hypothetical protein
MVSEYPAPIVAASALPNAYVIARSSPEPFSLGRCRCFRCTWPAAAAGVGQ